MDGSEETIEAQLRRGRPVLTLIEDRPARYHYVVIVATTPDAIVFRHHLPHTDSGKLLRRVVLQELTASSATPDQ